MTTYYEAILATVEFMETYKKALEEFDVECVLERVEQLGFFIQLTLHKSCSPGFFPLHVHDIPVLIVELAPRIAKLRV